MNGATWSGAKLSHLIKAVVYVVAGINGVPALVGLFLPHGDRFHGMVYPLAHLLIALGVGMVAALLCCSLFGWLIPLHSVRRLKAAAGMAQIVPMFFVFGFQFLNMLREDLVSWATSMELPEGWLALGDALPGGFPVLLGVAGGGGGLVVIFYGLRALSADHLIRVSGLMHSGRRMRRLKRRGWRVGPWVARFAGGQAGRAGFEYLRCMMLRDWQFLRNVAMIIPMVIFPFIFLLVAGWKISPFDSGFALMHFLPHLLGLAIILTCQFLAYGNDFKAIAWFFTAPDSSFRPFAGGIHAALWFLMAAVPNLLSLPVLAWSWAVQEAVLFVAFSTAVASLYLGVGLRLIDGVPFGKQAPPTRSAVGLGLILVFFMAAGISSGSSTFCSVHGRRLPGDAGGWVGARFLTRAVLDDFASRIRLQLKLAASGSVLLYKEVE